jgi:hypothetical protein
MFLFFSLNDVVRLLRGRASQDVVRGKLAARLARCSQALAFWGKTTLREEAARFNDQAAHEFVNSVAIRSSSFFGESRSRFTLWMRSPRPGAGKKGMHHV